MGSNVNMPFADDDQPVLEVPLERLAASLPKTKQDPCVVIGAKGSGKTQFVIATPRACERRVQGQPVMGFVIPNGDAGKDTRELIRNSADILTGKTKMEGTERFKRYQFEVALYRGRDHDHGRLPSQTVDFRVTDSAGEALFSEDELTEGRYMEGPVNVTQEIIGDAQRASSIILCVDMRAGQMVVHRHLPGRLGQMTTEQTFLRRPSFQDRLMQLFGKGEDPESVPLNRLRCKRFLVLLTKADQSAVHGCDLLKHSRPEISSATPMQFAQLLSPVDQAMQVLGVDTLNTIMSHLKPKSSHEPGAELAVGISSAGGFDLDGSPFLDADGVVNKTDLLSPAEHFGRWQPFGVREALLFAAFGQYSSLVHRVTPEHLEQGLRHSTLIASAT